MDEYIKALVQRIDDLEADISRVIHKHENLVAAHEHLVTQVQRHLIDLPFGDDDGSAD